TYTVAKLADGKCWMVENLRLDNTATLSPANTNVASDWTKLTNSINQSTGAIESESNHLTTPSTSGDYWCTTANSANCYNQSRLANQNVASSVNSMTSKNSNVYSYGNYYNWYSATAGYGTQEEGTQNKDMSGSICPNGWRLPTGGRAYSATQTPNITANRNIGTNRTASGIYIGFSDFYNLGYILMNSSTVISNGTGITAYMSNANNGYSYYGTNTTSTMGSFADKVYTETNENHTVTGSSLTGAQAFRTYPNNFLLSGQQTGASTLYRGSGGSYWSSTAEETEHANNLYVTISIAATGTGDDGKHTGYPARCLIGP
ncbi:hypothetical protein IKE79_00790, partial [Candidatus Saccharibacteria bacterium]|nr:hypothetical protein [Candidatus Saccharibacteria bacterium]